MDALNMTFPEEHFDVIISKASMPHVLIDPKKSTEENISRIQSWLQEALRVLKPNGEIRISTLNRMQEPVGKMIFEVLSTYTDTPIRLQELPNNTPLPQNTLYSIRKEHD